MKWSPSSNEAPQSFWSWSVQKCRLRASFFTPDKNGGRPKPVKARGLQRSGILQLGPRNNPWKFEPSSFTRSGATVLFVAGAERRRHLAVRRLMNGRNFLVRKVFIFYYCFVIFRAILIYLGGVRISIPTHWYIWEGVRISIPTHWYIWGGVRISIHTHWYIWGESE